METKKSATRGALRPILFAMMYVAMLFFSIFMCCSLFYSLNTDPSKEVTVKTKQPVKQQSFPVQVPTAVVVR